MSIHAPASLLWVMRPEFSLLLLIRITWISASLQSTIQHPSPSRGLQRPLNTRDRQSLVRMGPAENLAGFLEQGRAVDAKCLCCDCEQWGRCSVLRQVSTRPEPTRWHSVWCCAPASGLCLCPPRLYVNRHGGTACGAARRHRVSVCALVLGRGRHLSVAEL